MTTMAQEPSNLTLAVMNELAELSRTVAHDVADRSKARKMLMDLIKALEHGEVDMSARLLSERGALLIDLYPQSKPTLEKLRLDLNRRQEEDVRETFRQLEEYCRARNIMFKGTPPRLTIDYFINMELDREKNRTKVGTQALQSIRWSPIRTALEAERARLWERGFDAATFRHRLLSAYEQLERSNPGATGWVPLEEIYQILKHQTETDQPDWRKSGRLVAYYKDEFSVDLSLLWQAQSRNETLFPPMELSAIRDPRRAYKVLQPDKAVGTYGFMRFREVM